jgi:hypothetical protein
MFKKWTVSLLLIIIWLAASWAIFMPGFFRVHDFTHAARIEEMATALTEGQFPVRWVKNLGFGYGMPLFEFYAPLPYYVGAVFYWLGLDAVLTIKLLYLICSLVTVIGAYKLGADLFGRTGGVVTAAALTLAPYRAVNLFVRGALSEAWGIMALPWILYGLVLVIQKQKQGWVVLTLSLVTLMLSHNLTTLMFVPISCLFAIVYCLYYYRFNFSKIIKSFTDMLKIAGCYLVAIGMSAFYLFPALVENQQTQINSILSGYFDYSLHFLYVRQLITPFWGYGGSGWGPDDGLSFFLGLGQLIGLGLLLVFLLKSLVKPKIKTSIIISRTFFAVSLLGLMSFAIFMSLGHSQPVWQLLPFLTFIQFPWRWLSVVIVMLALLNGLAISLISHRIFRLVAMVSMILIFVGNAYYFRPESFAEHPEDIYYTDADKIQTQMSSILPDYIPIQMSKELKPLKEIAVIENGSNQEFEILVDRGHEKLIKLMPGSNDQIVNFSVADFPGWQAYIDAVKVDHEQGELGEIRIKVPAGVHQVGIRWESTPVRHYSDWVSVLSWLLFMFLALPNFLSKPANLNKYD